MLCHTSPIKKRQQTNFFMFEESNSGIKPQVSNVCFRYSTSQTAYERKWAGLSRTLQELYDSAREGLTSILSFFSEPEFGVFEQSLLPNFSVVKTNDSLGLTQFSWSFKDSFNNNDNNCQRSLQREIETMRGSNITHNLNYTKKNYELHCFTSFMLVWTKMQLWTQTWDIIHGHRVLTASLVTLSIQHRSWPN